MGGPRVTTERNGTERTNGLGDVGPFPADTLELGVYLASSWGRYNLERLVSLVDAFHEDGSITASVDEHARAIVDLSLYGEDGTDVTCEDGTVYTWEDACDISSELWDELTELLPSSPSRYWEWVDGELFLSAYAYRVDVTVTASYFVAVDDMDADGEYGLDEDTAKRIALARLARQLDGMERTARTWDVHHGPRARVRIETDAVDASTRDVALVEYMERTKTDEDETGTVLPHLAIRAERAERARKEDETNGTEDGTWTP